ncbi:MAG TPA: type IV toxin-antitoxin system AbiEi family antitoxin domain-containing protein [Solirubrobacteraceae bacterium]|nr:type IV toxin-antitoxin system AbiEi family antitoxin domain-containing protein [Solirubrobacteraceae bacterium]
MSSALRLTGAGRKKSTNRPDDAAVARLAATQNGVVSSRQLEARGIDAGATKRRVAKGQLHRVFRGVYAVGHTAVAQTGLFTAAVLACGRGAALGGHAAAAYHDMVRWDHRDIEVIAACSAGRRIDGIRPHRWKLDPRDVWTRDNIRITSPARTILDLASTLPFKALRRLVRQAMAEHKVNVRQLVDVLHRHPRHRGAATLRAVIANDPAPTKSDLEDLALDLLDNAGIDRPEVNPKLRLDGRTIHPDLLFRQHRLAIELDSRRWHEDRLTQQDDADKQAILEAHRYRVLRITWWQTVDHSQQTLRRIRAALAS